MNKIKILSIVLLLLLFLTTLAFAQWDGTDTLWTNSKVGIGTNTPDLKLRINDTATAGTEKGILRLFVNGGGGINHGCGMIYSNDGCGDLAAIYALDDSVGGRLEFRTASSQWTTTSTKMVIKKNGNVGIGTLNPAQKMEIAGTSEVRLRINAADTTTKGSILELFNGTSAKGYIYYGFTSTRGNWLHLEAAPGQGGISFDTNGYNPRMIVSQDGNVGIGETNPHHKLSVNGTIKAKEILVDITGWSDFVFKKDYNLKPLKEVEKHINEKGCLPEMPSEKDVIKNGYNLGEMDAKLLQKIEELTLYMIEIKKENEELKKELNKIKRNH